MSDIAPEFESSDAWILLAISFASRAEPVRLPEIIAVADYINHAIPTAGELDGALNRLLAGRFIARQKDAFAMTEAGKDAVAKASRRTKSVLDVWDDLAKLLACLCCGPHLRSVRRRVTVTKADARKAYEAYCAAIAPKRKRK